MTDSPLAWAQHRCDESCVCPAHDTPLIYWPAGNDHACQDPDCGYAHGMRELPGNYDIDVPDYPITDAEIAALPVLRLDQFHMIADHIDPEVTT